MTNLVKTGALDGEPTWGDQMPAPTRQRLVDRLDPRLVNVLTVLGFALPVFAYFWMVHRYA